MLLTFKNADHKLDKLVSDGRDIRWDNYTLVEFIENPRAIYNKNGVRRQDKWGFERRYDVNDKGLWYIPNRKA